MADIPTDVAFRISQSGAEEVAGQLENIVQGQGRAAQATGKWTQFIREQRTENRTTNFVVRESTQLVNTLAFATIALTDATGSASKGAQQLTRTLLSGAAAFQGTEFALKALGVASNAVTGGIGAMVGLGVAFYSFLDNSAEKAKKAAEQMTLFAEAARQAVEGIGPKQAGMSLAQTDALIAKLKADIKALEVQTPTTKGISTFDYEAEQAATGEMIARKESLELLKGQLVVQELYRKSLVLTISKAEEAAEVALRQANSQEEIDKKHKKFLESVPSFLDAQLATESLITEEIVRRIQLQITNQKALAEIFPEGLFGARTDYERMLKTPQAGRLLGKGVKLEEDYKDIHKVLVDTIHDTDRANMKEMQFLGLLDQGVGTLRSAVNLLGVSTDSFIGKLLQGLDVAMSIMKVIQGFSLIGSFLSLGAVEIPMGAITTAGPVLPLPKLGGTNTLGGASITINAVDARSFQQMLNSPENRRVFVDALGNATRLGIN